jgi:hypothetical protein
MFDIITKAMSLVVVPILLWAWSVSTDVAILTFRVEALQKEVDSREDDGATIKSLESSVAFVKDRLKEMQENL